MNGKGTKKSVAIALFALVPGACTEETTGTVNGPVANVVSLPALEGSSWQLVNIRDNLDNVYAPNNPENYLIRFRSENRLQIDADCNQAGAAWHQNEHNLTFSDLVTTRALCPPPSLFNRYIMGLENVTSFAMQNETLVLSTDVYATTLRFQPYVFSPL